MKIKIGDIIEYWDFMNFNKVRRFKVLDSLYLVFANNRQVFVVLDLDTNRKDYLPAHWLNEQNVKIIQSQNNYNHPLTTIFK